MSFILAQICGAIVLILTVVSVQFKTKEKIKQRIHDLAERLFNLYVERSKIEGFAFAEDDDISSLTVSLPSFTAVSYCGGGMAPICIR